MLINNNKITLLILGLAVFSASVLSAKSASAVLFSVTEVTTDEGFVYSANNPNRIFTPTDLNSVAEFKVRRDGNLVDTYTIGSEPSESNFVALEVSGVDVPFVIQPRGSRNNNPGTNFFLPRQVDYISAGTNGLSMSTGLNKVFDQDQEIFTFPVLTLDESKVGDNVVDIFVGDIAQNQSFDKWELLDSNGATVASIVPQPQSESNADWTRIGTQNLERVDTETGDVSLLEIFFTNPRSTYALALELSDFQLEAPFGSGSLTSSQASLIDSMKISIGETPTTQPKTDYAFFAADTESVTFDIGSSNIASVPFEFSPTLGLMLSGVGVCFYKLKSNKNLR